MGGCWDDPPAAPDPDLIEAANGRLQATFAAPTQSVTLGTSAIQLSSTGRFFGLYVPSTYNPAVPTPVIVMLHGFNGSGEQTVLDFRDVAERAGAVLVAPNSRGQTWDLILNNVGFDVAFIDGIMRWTFDHVNVDPTRLTLGGFSDGATYATWLGLRNGALFPRVAVFSGCATVPTGRRGTPKLFVTHGLVDSAFPIDNCSRPLVPGLRERGYSVEYREHELGHVVPIIIADEIFAWVATG
jgi:phospholipase/carboxylesterase